jgi:hypothetical protein
MNTSQDPIWRTQLPQLASCAIMYMATVYAPMRGEQMEAIVRLMETRVTWDLPTAAYLSAATWCLARHPENRAWMLRDPEERTAHAIVNVSPAYLLMISQTVHFDNFLPFVPFLLRSCALRIHLFQPHCIWWWCV